MEHNKNRDTAFTSDRDVKQDPAPIHGRGSIALESEPGETIPQVSDVPAADCRRVGDRRQSFWRSLVYGNFKPRRRSSRRSFDEGDYLFDWHEPRVLYLALGILLLSCADALFTLNLLNLGAEEANIVMATALEGGIDRFVTLKIILTSFSVVVLVITARRSFMRSYKVEHVLQLMFLAYLMVIFYELYIFGFVFEFNLLRGG